MDANDLSPKEATQMSRDIKYIGMDVHKEAMLLGAPEVSLRKLPENGFAIAKNKAE